MSGVRRSRWAAIGAAVAVSLGAGGLGLARASTGVESSFVSVTPARVLDTRAGLGLAGPLVSPTPAVLEVSGSIARPSGPPAVVVPTGASAVVLNVTVVGPTADGYLSVRPDGTPGPPSTSNLNFAAGDIIPNAVTVALPSSGKIELTYDAFGGVGPTTDVLVDVTGFYTPSSGGGGATGPAGPQGPKGETGDTGAAGPQGPKGDSGLQGPKGDIGLQGPKGDIGLQGPKGDIGLQGPKGDSGDTGPGYDLAQVVWVAKSGGDFTSLGDALDAIGDTLPAGTAADPYVVKIAPGVYTETGTVALKNFVDVEGSGQGVTTLECACGSDSPPVGVVTAGNITAEIRHLTISNTGGGDFAAAVTTNGVINGQVSLLHLTATGTGGSSFNYGVVNASSSPSMNYVTAIAIATGNSSNVGVLNASSSSPSMNNVTATATGGTTNYGLFNTSSSPSMNHVTSTATDGSNNNYGVFNNLSSPSMNNVTATATGGSNNVGVLNVSSSSPSIRGSSIQGTTNSVSNNSSSAKIADTTLTGSVDGDGFTCVGVHDQNFVELSTGCTPLPPPP